MSPSEKENPHYLRGVAMALTTTLLWGFLPIFLKIALKEFSPQTIVGFRFLFAFVALMAFLVLKRDRPLQILTRPPGLGVLAGLALAANYFYFLQGVNFSGPANGAIVVQTAPVIVVLAGVFLFKERFNRQQVAGLVIASLGFYIFFLDMSAHVKDADLYTKANFNILVGAALWAVYMVFQKTLSKDFQAQHLNLLVYGVAALVFFPMAIWGEFAGVGIKTWALMIFLGLNTLLAYGALAEAIKRIPLSLISVMITLNPLITLAATRALPLIFPGLLVPEMIDLQGYIGACIAVAGVVLVVRK